MIAKTLHDHPQGHGLGFGKITGKGHGDFVFPDGILEAPETPDGEWSFSQEFDLDRASVPIIVVDVNGNGLSDFIVGMAHDYGLDWYEQTRDASGKRQWIKHPIDPDNSQYHDMIWADIDGDGQCELITGKRMRAHNGHDAGAFDDPNLCYFKWNGESFTKQVISTGADGKGCGIFFAVADLRGTGRLDVIAPGKDGLVVFYNEGV